MVSQMKSSEKGVAHQMAKLDVLEKFPEENLEFIEQRFAPTPFKKSITTKMVKLNLVPELKQD
jgi:hypothetical protein